MKKDKNESAEAKIDNEITELEQKIGEITAGWQRTQADFQNYRRQVAEDRQKLIKMANSDLMLEILPVLDNFQLAARHVPAELENDNWVIGIKQIEKQLEQILENNGLNKIETAGKQFDPSLHEAVDHIESDLPEDEIVEEVSAGYALDGLVMRPAKVKVSKGK